MGDLTKENLENIWNNELYINLRRKMSLNQTPELCNTCYRNKKYLEINNMGEIKSILSVLIEMPMLEQSNLLGLKRKRETE